MIFLIWEIMFEHQVVMKNNVIILNIYSVFFIVIVKTTVAFITTQIYITLFAK